MKTTRSWQRQRAAAPYLFLLPFVATFCVFFAYPLFRSLWLSFHNTLGPRLQWFVGLDNYRFLMTDRIFWLSALNTAAFTLAFLLVQIPVSIVLAVLLNAREIRGRALLRFAFFSTYLVGPVFAAVIFAILLDARAGLLNRLLSWILRQPVEIGWLTDPRLAMLSVLLAALWIGTGFGSVYVLAALQSIDRDLYDASSVDGAGSFRRFWHITLPGLRPAISFLVLVGTVVSLQLFELPYVLFNGAGPGHAGMTLVMYLFVTGFQAGNLGYASAIGWTFVGLVLAVVGMQSRLLKRRSLAS